MFENITQARHGAKQKNIIIRSPADYFVLTLVDWMVAPDMHELSVTQSVLDIALEHAKVAQAEKITRINLVIGEMSSIVDDCVQFYFDFISKGGIASNATLSFHRIPTQVRCRNCATTFSPKETDWECPNCGEWNVEITAGQEFYIDSIEVE